MPKKPFCVIICTKSRGSMGLPSKRGEKMNTIYPKRKHHPSKQIKRLTREEELAGFKEVIQNVPECESNLFQLKHLLIEWNMITRICCKEEGNERVQELIEDAIDTTPIRKRKFQQVDYRLKVSPDTQLHIFTLKRKIAKPERIIIKARENEVLLVKTTLDTEKVEEFFSKNKELLYQLRLVGTVRQLEKRIAEKNISLKEAKREELEAKEERSPIGFPNRMEREQLLKGVEYNLYEQNATPLFTEKLQVPYMITIDKTGKVSYRYQQEIEYEGEPYEHEPVKVTLPSILSTNDTMLSLVQEKIDKRIPIEEDKKQEELKQIEEFMEKYNPSEKLKVLR